jgi:hypothetical protein
MPNLRLRSLSLVVVAVTLLCSNDANRTHGRARTNSAEDSPQQCAPTCSATITGGTFPVTPNWTSQTQVGNTITIVVDYSISGTCSNALCVPSGCAVCIYADTLVSSGGATGPYGYYSSTGSTSSTQGCGTTFTLNRTTTDTGLAAGYYQFNWYVAPYDPVLGDCPNAANYSLINSFTAQLQLN